MLKTLQALFRPRSPEEDMARELFEARKALLEALSGQEYAAAMVEYHQTRIKRLQASLQEVSHDNA